MTDTKIQDYKKKKENEVYKPVLINDHFQNYKSYNIPKAQLVIADIPYNVGKDAYGSNPSWYEGGDNKNGESKLANTEFFDTDKDFRVSEFLSFLQSNDKKRSRKKKGKDTLHDRILLICNSNLS